MDKNDMSLATVLYLLDLQKTGVRVAVDSRLVCPGALFFALRGARDDGHHHLAEVAAKGATTAVVSTVYAGPDYGLKLVFAENPMQILQEMAKTALQRWKGKVVAITGSLGKTTTKGFTLQLLESRFRVTASPGNQNSQIGLPLTILNELQGDEELLVLEMGMTLPGHIAQLTQIAPPDIAVITTVALVHACNFESLEEIAHAKAEIFSHPHTTVGILSSDIRGYEAIAAKGSCNKISFSLTHPNADYYLCEMGEHLQVHMHGKTAQLPPLPVVGKHNRHNFLAAAAVAHSLGLSWEEIAEAVPRLSLPALRLQRVEKEGILFINDAYNASEDSFKAAFQNLPIPKAGGKRVAVIGEILELGKFSEGCHREVALAALQAVDEVICTGNGCGPIWESWNAANRPITWVKEREKLASVVNSRVAAGDVVLLKGSRSNRLWELLS
jgi:UDP-N-acetylmuramoyl-tripeptide--D-alanyl-D-alanine ligase